MDPEKWIGKVANSFAMNGHPKAVNQFPAGKPIAYSSNTLWIQFEPPHNKIDYIYIDSVLEPLKIKANKSLTNVFVLGVKEGHYTLDLNKEKTVLSDSEIRKDIIKI